MGGANKVAQKSKDAKMIAALAAGRSAPKKWNKGKAAAKSSNLVMFDTATYERLMKEVPKAKLITPAVVSERLKVNGSVAREGIRHLERRGFILPVSERHSDMIYTRAG